MNFRVSCSKRFEKIDDLHPDMNIQMFFEVFAALFGHTVRIPRLTISIPWYVPYRAGLGTLVGLCHVSELSDEHIDNIEASYATGDKVVSKILKVSSSRRTLGKSFLPFYLFCTQIDEERQRISLGMKKSYIENASGVDQSHAMNGSHDHVESDSASMDNELIDLLHNDDLIKHHKMLGHDNVGSEIFTPSGRSSSVLPLQVSLEDSDGSDLDNPIIAGQDGAKENEQAAKRDRCLKKKAKDEKELEIIAAEERRLQNDMPRTEDEFEKLVRRSPNSSFVWIKYMAFMLSVAETEKARNVAERYGINL
ncbi:hypothetical protein GW17_00025642 [Ensete ventricosum]|nr:hypothetical protein GW17_00025642 [Ensete ventricosum]